MFLLVNESNEKRSEERYLQSTNENTGARIVFRYRNPFFKKIMKLLTSHDQNSVQKFFMSLMTPMTPSTSKTDVERRIIFRLLVYCAQDKILVPIS